MASRNFCISSRAPSQLPVKISAAIFPHNAEKHFSSFVDWQKSVRITCFHFSSYSAYQHSIMIQHVGSTAITATIKLELTEFIQNIDGFFCELSDDARRA